MLLPVVTTYAQGSRQIATRKIHELISTTIEQKKGVEIERTTHSIFDRKGRLVLETVFDNDSICISKETFQYNRKGDITVHNSFEKEKGDGETKEIIEYDRWNRDTLKTEYDMSGKVKQTTSYRYNNADEKTSESVFDAEKKLLRTTTFTYDKRGMLLNRKTVNSKGQVIYEKNNQYTY